MIKYIIGAILGATFFYFWVSFVAWEFPINFGEFKVGSRFFFVLFSLIFAFIGAAFMCALCEE